MGKLARTPENFPRMKNRAAGRAVRNQRRQWDKVLEAIDAAKEAMRAVTLIFSEMALGLGSAMVSLGEALRPRPQDVVVDEDAPH